MTTKELITAKIIQDITERSGLTSFDVIVTRVYNWLYSLGFDVSCTDYTLTDNTYRRVYNHPKYGTLSVKLNRSSVRNDVANLVNFVVNMEELPATQTINQRVDRPIQQCSEYDDLLNIRKQCIRKEYIDNAVNDLAKVVTSLGRLIDWLNACGYTTQVNSDNEYEILHVVIKSPHSDSTCTYRYNTELRDIFRYVIIEDHVHSVALRIAKFFIDNMVDRTKASLNFDEFAAQYGWKHQFLTDEDNTWGWVKNGILYPLPYRSGEYMDNYKHVIHEIVGHVQCEELRLV